ncbi:MAG: aminotransferase class V-fold PLP-dependent enzyme [Halioglobus sp.]
MKRRHFLQAAGTVLTSASLISQVTKAETDNLLVKGDWTAFRKLFPLRDDRIQLATFLLASHPEPVANAIQKFRKELDYDPVIALVTHDGKVDEEVRNAAAAYMGGKGDQIALTDSTTMGSAMVYSGLELAEGDEILHTTHDHYATFMAIEHRAQRTGAKVRQVAMYDNAADTTVKDCVSRLEAAINPATKVVAVTWVHSSTGVKLPIRALADSIEKINAKRSAARQIIFCVDGVHGFGIEDVDVSELGCDFFIAGTHKWTFGPRGTGLVWGNDKGWEQSQPVIPSFGNAFDVWLNKKSDSEVTWGDRMTPGGFHSFEHRWALPAAFALHQQLGKAKVQSRIHGLNTQVKEGLAKMPNVTLHTPMASELSSGLVAYEVSGKTPLETTYALFAKGLVSAPSPYHESYARMAPSLLNTEQELDTALAHVASIAS